MKKYVVIGMAIGAVIAWLAAWNSHRKHKLWMDAANCASYAIEAGSSANAERCFTDRGLTAPWHEDDK